MKQWTEKEIAGLLFNNGYIYKRSRGSHKIYINNNNRHISIPKSINPCIVHRLIKQYNLK